ncbi:MAG: hypothetical protein R2861_16285 [Desulfobacterales bacterium]
MQDGGFRVLINCAESWVRDIGLFASLRAGPWWSAATWVPPRLAQEFLTELDDDQALEKIARIVDFYKKKKTPKKANVSASR